MCDIDKFIEDHVQWLKIEKKCYLYQVEEAKKSSGTLFGTVVKKTEPLYPGTIVTLQLRSNNKNAELSLKQGNPRRC